MALLSNPLRKLRQIWTLAKNERATPREIGLAVFVGAFIGFSPALGFHGALALAVATLLKHSRLWSWLGSRSSNMFIIPFTAYAQVEVAHMLRTGSWLALDREHVLDQTKILLLDWMLGMIPVGLPISAIIGLLAFSWARKRARRKAAEPDAPEDAPHDAPT